MRTAVDLWETGITCSNVPTRSSEFLRGKKITF